MQRKDEIPVSVVDLDIPVTSIDDVLHDNRSNMSAYEVSLQRANLKKRESSYKPTVDLQNKNNNATRVAQAQAGQNQTHSYARRKEMVNIGGRIQSDAQTELSRNPVSYASKNPVPDCKTLPTKPLPEGPTPYQRKITHNPMSRFGLKTFTIVPPKPAVSQTPKATGSLRTGAIKIDEFGNMVRQTDARDTSGFPGEVSHDLDSPLLGKAKAFWNSAQKQDASPPTNHRASLKTRESKPPETATVLEKSSLQQTKQVSGSANNLSSVRTREAELLGSETPVQMVSREKEQLNIQEPLKHFGGSTPNLASAVMKKLAIANPAESMFFSEHRKNFLMPTRRTSSQYVASAIAKYSGNSSTMSGVQDVPESTSGAQKQVTNRGSLAVCATSRPKTTNQDKSSYVKSATSNFKTLPTPTTSFPYNAAPKWSQSHIAKKVEQPSQEFTTISTKSLNSSPVKTTTQLGMYPKPTQLSTKDSTRANKLPENTAPLQSPTQPRPSVAKKPEISILAAPSESNQTGLFGPVKKFKPVVPKTVEKENSLHSSLMEAIQSGRGTERLKKVRCTTDDVRYAIIVGCLMTMI